MLTPTPLLLYLVFSLSLFPSLIQCSSPSSSSSFLRLPTQKLPNEETCPITTSRPASCPVRCFRPDPVCGENGVTYWCGCSDAACNGIRVVKLGFCEVGNGGSGQALFLVHIVWLIVLGFFVVFGLF